MKMIRRFLTLLFVFLLLAVPARASVDYTDVPKAHWAYADVERASELGLIGGVGGGRFGLGQQTTRAEYATMLCRLMGWTMLTPEKGSFADNQNPGEWYYSPIETAYANGALRKLGENVGVNEPLTREEMAAMTVRALGYAALAGVVQDDCPFDDVSTNRGYITLAYHLGIMGGAKARVFVPSAIATREQAAVVLLRVRDAMRAGVEQETVSAPPQDAVCVEPLDDRDGRVPMCPRAPLEGVYDAALRAGKCGAVAIYTTPYNAGANKTIKQSELNAILRGGVRVYRSTRYQSSYVSAGSSVVWFESDEDIAEKVMLCRLMGVDTVYLIQ